MAYSECQPFLKSFSTIIKHSLIKDEEINTTLAIAVFIF